MFYSVHTYDKLRRVFQLRTITKLINVTLENGFGELIPTILTIVNTRQILLNLEINGAFTLIVGSNQLQTSNVGVNCMIFRQNAVFTPH